MANKTFVERRIPDYRKDELGVIVRTSGRRWLCVVEELSWKKNGHKHKSKLDILLNLAKQITPFSWEEVFVDIK